MQGAADVSPTVQVGPVETYLVVSNTLSDAESATIPLFLGAATSASFSQDGACLVTHSVDGTLRLFRLAQLLSRSRPPNAYTQCGAERLAAHPVCSLEEVNVGCYSLGHNVLVFSHREEGSNQRGQDGNGRRPCTRGTATAAAEEATASVALPKCITIVYTMEGVSTCRSQEMQGNPAHDAGSNKMTMTRMHLPCKHYPTAVAVHSEVQRGKQSGEGKTTRAGEWQIASHRLALAFQESESCPLPATAKPTVTASCASDDADSPPAREGRVEFWSLPALQTPILLTATGRTCGDDNPKAAGSTA